MDELRQIQIIAEGDFVDLDLPMASFDRDLDGVQEISARGRHSHASVGFVVSLGPVWERRDLENSDTVLYWGRAELVSMGNESDAFLRLLDELYCTGLGHQKMRERVSVSCSKPRRRSGSSRTRTCQDEILLRE